MSQTLTYQSIVRNHTGVPSSTTASVSTAYLQTSLDYHNLDERCQNGGHAMTIFPRIQFMEPEEAAASREALLRYCELDTWAMVKVWEKLKEVAE